MSDRASQENRGGKFENLLKRPGVREFRGFLKKLALRKYKNYRGIAEKLCVDDGHYDFEDLLERRTRQVEHFLNDPEDGDPRMSLGRAVEELVLGEGITLPAEDYGWDPTRP